MSILSRFSFLRAHVNSTLTPNITLRPNRDTCSSEIYATYRKENEVHLSDESGGVVPRERIYAFLSQCQGTVLPYTSTERTFFASSSLNKMSETEVLGFSYIVTGKEKKRVKGELPIDIDIVFDLRPIADVFYRNNADPDMAIEVPFAIVHREPFARRSTEKMTRIVRRKWDTLTTQTSGRKLFSDRILTFVETVSIPDEGFIFRIRQMLFWNVARVLINGGYGPALSIFSLANIASADGVPDLFVQHATSLLLDMPDRVQEETPRQLMRYIVYTATKQRLTRELKKTSAEIASGPDDFGEHLKALSKHIPDTDTLEYLVAANLESTLYIDRVNEFIKSSGLTAATARAGIDIILKLADENAPEKPRTSWGVEFVARLVELATGSRLRLFTFEELDELSSVYTSTRGKSEVSDLLNDYTLQITEERYGIQNTVLRRVLNTPPPKSPRRNNWHIVQKTTIRFGSHIEQAQYLPGYLMTATHDHVDQRARIVPRSSLRSKPDRLYITGATPAIVTYNTNSNMPKLLSMLPAKSVEEQEEFEEHLEEAGAYERTLTPEEHDEILTITDTYEKRIETVMLAMQQDLRDMSDPDIVGRLQATLTSSPAPKSWFSPSSWLSAHKEEPGEINDSVIALSPTSFSWSSSDDDD